MNGWSDEETDNHADHRYFYKVEKWTKDNTKIDRMLYAGNNLDEAQEMFAVAVKHRPAGQKLSHQRVAAAGVRTPRMCGAPASEFHFTEQLRFYLHLNSRERS